MPHGSEQEIAVFSAYNNLELRCDMVLNALFAKWFVSQLKNLQWYGIQKPFVVTVFIGHWSGNFFLYA